MASNHPCNYVGLGRKLKDAIDLGKKELDPRNAVILRPEKNRVIRKCSEVLGEAVAKEKELIGKSKYTKNINQLRNIIGELTKK